jgi:hypothetical protein
MVHFEKGLFWGLFPELLELAKRIILRSVDSGAQQVKLDDYEEEAPVEETSTGPVIRTNATCWRPRHIWSGGEIAM